MFIYKRMDQIIDKSLESLYGSKYAIQTEQIRKKKSILFIFGSFIRQNG